MPNKRSYRSEPSTKSCTLVSNRKTRFIYYPQPFPEQDFVKVSSEFVLSFVHAKRTTYGWGNHFQTSVLLRDAAPCTEEIKSLSLTYDQVYGSAPGL